MDKEQPLVDRLKLWPAVERGDALNAGFVSDLLTEAADALASAQAEIAKLREALTWAECHDPWLVDQIRERAGASDDQ
jgi:hypothetical protein